MNSGRERRGVLSCVPPILAACVLFVWTIGCGRTDEARPPETVQASAGEWRGGIAPHDLNIVLVTLDTLRSDRLSCYGSDLVDTPNIDRMPAKAL